MAAACSRSDIARFRAEIPRFSPRQADLMFVVGTVNHKLAPYLRRIWEQMPEPKWVIAMGVCASTGGFYDNYPTGPGLALPLLPYSRWANWVDANLISAQIWISYLFATCPMKTNLNIRVRRFCPILWPWRK